MQYKFPLSNKLLILLTGLDPESIVRILSNNSDSRGRKKATWVEYLMNMQLDGTLILA